MVNNCTVMHCMNNSKKKKHISYFCYPKDSNRRNNWLKAVGREDLVPKISNENKQMYRICEEHFDKSNIVYSKNRTRKFFADFAFPSLNLPTNDGALNLMDASAVDVSHQIPDTTFTPTTYFSPVCDTKVEIEVEASEPADSIPCCCRICLNSDCKLKPMKLYGLRGAYELMTGIPLNHDDELPQVLCVECATHLLKYHKFRDKCLQASEVLHDINLTTISTGGDVQVEMIKRARANIEKLHTNLTCCNLVEHLDIPSKPYVVASSSLNKDFNESNHADNCNDNVLDDIESIDIKLEKTSDPSIGDEEWIESDMIDEVNGLSEDNSKDNDHDSSDSEETTDKPTSKSKINKKTAKANEKRIKTIVDKSNDNYPNKLTNKLIELVAIDGLDENDYIKLQKRRYNKVGELTVKKIKIKKKRDAFLEECFVKKTLLSLKEQISSYEKLKHCESYVKANFKCELCYRGYINEQYLKNHNKKYHSTFGKHDCQVCKMRCKTEWGVLLHIHRHHVYEYQCKTCDETFCHYASAESHARKHKGIKHVCEHCGQEFEMTTVYLYHLRLKHPSSDHVCLICGYSFVSKFGLSSHTKKAHKGKTEDEFADVPCNTCDLKFASEEALKIHIGIKHSDGKPLYNAPKTKRQIRKEAKVVKKKEKIKWPRTATKPLAEFPVPCEVCGVEISSFQQYHVHFLQAHPDMKRTIKRTQSHMCDQCGKKFYAKSVLIDHLLTHGSESSIKCPKCDKTFKSKFEMKSHVRLNHDEPVKCHICGQLITKVNLNRHIMVKHTEGKKVECEHCGKSFKTKYDVKNHTKYVHMNVPWPKKRNAGDGPPVKRRRRFQQNTPEGEIEDTHNFP